MGRGSGFSRGNPATSATTGPGPRPSSLDVLGAAERFWKLVDRSGGPDACWPWKGALSNKGYGQFHLGGRTVLAHHVACVLAGRHIPADLVPDHLCRRRDCVNPGPLHVEPVTNRENILRGTSPCAENARKTACVRGHAFDDANTVQVRHGRECRACRQERERLRPKRDRREYNRAYHIARTKEATT